MRDDEAGLWLFTDEHSLDAGALTRWATLGSTGAVVTFSGTARDHGTIADGTKIDGVTHLEYELFSEGVEAVLLDIAAEARSRYESLARIAVGHRSGLVEVSGTAVVVAVSSAHRHAAFEAAEFVIDQIKHRAPIWKREHWSGGSSWSAPCDHRTGELAMAAGRR